MKRSLILAVGLATIILCPGVANAAGEIHRYALVIGANFGGSDRPMLQYAVSDAEHFARVMEELGGIAAADAIVLKQPKLRELTDALDALGRRVNDAHRLAAAAGGGRTEVFLYYSGHADEKGVLLGEDRYSYQSLRDRLDLISADVRIAVLDACASGAFTRIKGGKARPAFLVDESADMRGHAFLTSSAETEAAQESDRIGASYFTHYLVSGLRGAADLSGDGKVTLNEAYQFAFSETLGRTVQSRGGPQHPSYDISLSGSGDVVMTDVHETSATLVLPEDLDGRFFIRNSSQQLVVELYKPAGRKVELGLEPGTYEVRIERKSGFVATKARMTEGSRIVLDAAQLAPTTPEPTRARGHHGPPSFAMAGRNRLELTLGVGASGISGEFAGDSLNLGAGLNYSRWVREDLAFTFGIESLVAQSGSWISDGNVFAGDLAVVGLPFGVRWNPFVGNRRPKAYKPYLEASLGPVIAASDGATVTAHHTYAAGSLVSTSVGGLLGAGIDVHPGRSWSIGLSGGYFWTSGLDTVPANPGGFQLRIGLGWVFGKGYAQ